MTSFPSKYGDIYLGPISRGLQEAIDTLAPSSVIVIADTNTAEYCLPLLEKLIDIHRVITISPGENHKTMASCQKIWSAMLEADADRSCLVLNIGGGMICDMGGFAASCFKRGVRFGHIPTSLLAMTDAAIGGKTGINQEGFKNLIGHFEIPSLTWIDPDFLKTLPSKELSDGMAEVIKHAIIASRDLWRLLAQAEAESPLDWLQIISLSAPIKQRIVEQDPYEKGIRKTLNFGHTIGHALESHFLQMDKPLSHGKAITLGMLAESRIAQQQGMLETEEFNRIIALIMRLLRPSEVTLPRMDVLQHWLQGDKKKSKGILGYSLPDSIGSCQWDIQVEASHVEDSLNWLSTHLKASS